MHGPDTRDGGYPLVVVVWEDAWYDPDENEMHDFRTDYRVTTVGFLIRQLPVVSIAQEVLPDGEGFRAVTHIPRAMVVSMRNLGEMVE
jgi:hypothetical protein